MVTPGILDRIAAGVVLADGGYLLELEHRGYVQAGAYTPEVVVECPDAVRQLHVEFKRAGAEVLQALTFYGSRDKLASGGRLAAAEEVNRTAVRIARAAAGDDTLVAGGLTLTPAFCAGPVARSRASDLMTEQVAWQQDEGIDFIVGETFCALIGGAFVTSRPVNGLMILGGAGMLLATTHDLAHWAVGRAVGIRFTELFITRPSRPQPGIKIDYATYLRTPPRARAWMHASGALVTKAVPFALIPIAVAARAPR